MVLHDAHNHLHFEEIHPYRERILADLAASSIQRAVVNGSHPDDWDAVAKLALRLPWVKPSFGIHPWDVGRRPADWREVFETTLQTHPTAAVGEIGLDGWILRAAPDDPRLAGSPRASMADQVEVCAWQLARAAALDRPASLHCTDAWEPLRDLLRNTPVPAGGFLLHAYAGPPALVPEFVARGAYFSFNPCFLDPRRKRARSAFAAVPADRLLVETDAPFAAPPAGGVVIPLPPLPDGMNLSHPVNLEAAYAGLAALRNQPPEELAAQVDENFTRLFGPA